MTPEITIRPATLSDVERVAELGRNFFDEAGWSDVASWDDVSIRRSLSFMVDSDDAILIVVDDGGCVVGMAGGVVSPAYFNEHLRIGQELFWWVMPEYRTGVGSRLLSTLEDAARERGASAWTMITLARVRPEAVGRLYERRGYRAAEHSYVRAL